MSMPGEVYEMNNLIKRMQATIRMNIIANGDHYDRLIAESQFTEAMKRIDELEADNRRMKKVMQRYIDCQDNVKNNWVLDFLQVLEIEK